MREIEYVTKGFFGGTGVGAPGIICDGYFHGFYRDRDFHDEFYGSAIIETLDGKVLSLRANQIKFKSPRCTGGNKMKIKIIFVIFFLLFAAEIFIVRESYIILNKAKIGAVGRGVTK